IELGATRELEADPQRQRDGASCARAVDLAVGLVGLSAGGSIEGGAGVHTGILGVVGSVEHLGAELHELALAEQREALGDGEVPVVDSGAGAYVGAGVAEIGHGDVRVAPRTDGWRRSHTAVEPLVEGMRAGGLAGAEEVGASAFGR